MHLTHQGNQFYQDARRILESLEEAKDRVKKEGQSLSGTIKVACPVSFGVAHVIPLVASFMHLHPNVRIDLDVNDKRLDLVESGFDLAIRIGHLQDSSYKARKLSHFTHVVCGSPDFFKQHGYPKRPEDLTRLPALCYGNLKQPDVWHYRSNKRIVGKNDEGNVKVPIKMQVSNGDALRECAIAGLGVLCEPSFIVHEAINKGFLQAVLTDYIWYGMEIFAVYPATQFVPARLRAFIDYLAEQFGDQPYWEDFLKNS
jgi:DNA-binding transcriptional LysR family regulator